MNRRLIDQATAAAPRLAAWLLLAILAAALLRHLIITLPFPYPVEYGEGVTVNWLLRYRNGLSLYPAMVDEALPWLHNPYGPLWYILAALLQAVGGGVFNGARALSMLGFALCTLVIYRLARRQLSTGGAFWITVLFAASPLLWRYALMARVDLPALAFSLAALLMMERAWQESTDTKDRKFAVAWPWFGAGALAAAAILIKPFFIAAALTGLTVGWSDWRRRAIPFALGLVAALIPAVFWLLWRGEMEIASHFGTMNRIGIAPILLPRIALAGIARHPAAILLLVGALLRPDRASPTRWFAVFSLLVFLGAIKVGADVHYFIGPLAAGAVIGPALVKKWQQTRSEHFVSWCLAAQLMLYLPIAPRPVFTATYGQEIPTGHAALTPTQDDRRIGRYLSEEISGENEPILADDPGYLLAAGRPVQIQPYQYGRLAEIGRLDCEPLRQLVKERYFALVILRHSHTGEAVDSDLPPPVVEAVLENYNPHREIGPYIIYLPNP